MTDINTRHRLTVRPDATSASSTTQAGPVAASAEARTTGRARAVEARLSNLIRQIANHAERPTQANSGTKGLESLLNRVTNLLSFITGKESATAAGTTNTSATAAPIAVTAEMKKALELQKDLQAKLETASKPPPPPTPAAPTAPAAPAPAPVTVQASADVKVS